MRKTPHCKSYNPVMKLTKMGARGRVYPYSLPVALGLRYIIGRLRGDPWVDGDG